MVRVAVAPEGGARPVFRGGAAALPINVMKLRRLMGIPLIARDSCHKGCHFSGMPPARYWMSRTCGRRVRREATPPTPHRRARVNRRDLRETRGRLGSKPLDAIIREKRPAGGKAYGYTPVKGEPGRLLIVECEANTARRI